MHSFRSAPPARKRTRCLFCFKAPHAGLRLCCARWVRWWMKRNPFHVPAGMRRALKGSAKNARFRAAKGGNGSRASRAAGGSGAKKCPCPTFRSNRDKLGVGVRHALFPVPTLGAPAAAGLPASRRHSPRQAESSASWQGRPAPCGTGLLSEAFQLAWAGGCATGLRTRSRHGCGHIPRLHHLALGGHRFWRCVDQGHGSRLLPLRLSFTRSPAVLVGASPAFGSFSRGLPSRRGLPDADAPFVRLSAVFAGRIQELESAGVACAVLVRSNNRVPSGQLRFVRDRNSPELLDSTRSGFSSLLAAEPLFRVADTRERARGAGESCLRPPDLSVGLQRGRANQPGPTFPRSPGRISNRAAASFRLQPPILFFQRTAITLARSAFLTTNSYPQVVHGFAPERPLAKLPIPAKILLFRAQRSELSTVKKTRRTASCEKVFRGSEAVFVCALQRDIIARRARAGVSAMQSVRASNRNDPTNHPHG